MVGAAKIGSAVYTRLAVLELLICQNKEQFLSKLKRGHPPDELRIGRSPLRILSNPPAPYVYLN